MRTRITSVTLTAFAATVLLAGCTTPSPTPGTSTGPVPTVTVAGPTVTVTAPGPTPTATANARGQNPTDPMTPLGAWMLCWAAVRGYGDPEPEPGYAPYLDTGLKGNPVTDNGDGTYDVLIFQGESSDVAVNQTTCTAGGTLGAPTVDVGGTTDYR